jgi:hypothetical protein
MCSKNAKYVWKLQPYTVCRANYVIFEAEQLQECSCKQMNERKNALSTLSLSEKNTARFLRTVLQHCTPVYNAHPMARQGFSGSHHESISASKATQSSGGRVKLLF